MLDAHFAFYIVPLFSWFAAQTHTHTYIENGMFRLLLFDLTSKSYWKIACIYYALLIAKAINIDEIQAEIHNVQFFKRHKLKFAPVAVRCNLYSVDK